MVSFIIDIVNCSVTVRVLWS